MKAIDDLTVEDAKLLLALFAGLLFILAVMCMNTGPNGATDFDLAKCATLKWSDTACVG